MTDVLQELYDEFPEIEKNSIDKICKAGLVGINKLMRQGEELIVQTEGLEEIKFYIPSNPETQDKLTQENRRSRRFKEIRKQNGETSK